MPGRDSNSPATNAAANEAARAGLFQNGFFSSIELPAQAWADGGSYAFQLPHAGIGLYCQLRMTGTLTWTGANAPVLSTLAPFNIFQSIKYVDYLGNTRISAGGPTLHAIEVFKNYDDTAGETTNATAKRGYSNPIIDVFAPGGVSGTGVPYDISLQVPFTLHENTSVGTIPFTIPAGNNVLYVTLNPLLNPSFAAKNAESPLQSATSTPTASATGSLYCTYYYIDPLPGQELPLMDFSQVYEIVDVKSTDNLAASATKQIILPTGRTYQGLYAQLVNGGQLTDTGVQELKFLINESTPTLDEFYASYLHRTRRTYGRDMQAGMFLWDLRARPISPSNYGSIALQTLFSNAFVPAGEVFHVLGKESLYVLSTNVY